MNSSASTPAPQNSVSTDLLSDKTRLETADLSSLIARLIRILQQQFQESAEMLALLDQHHLQGTGSSVENVMRLVAAVNQQLPRIQAARQQRESCQRYIARLFDQDPSASLETLIPLLAPAYRIALETLVRENQLLLLKIHTRARENQLILARCLELMQQFITAFSSIGVSSPDQLLLQNSSPGLRAAA